MESLHRDAIVAELNICIIDDDQDVLHAVRRLLRAAGFAAQTFSSAEEFLESQGQSNPDCLVLDVHMGGISGFALQDHLVASGRSIPIVFITAQDEHATRERAEQRGAAEYLRKPFEDQSLIGAIHRAIGRDTDRPATRA